MTRSEFIQRSYLVTQNLDRTLTLTKKLEESDEAPFDDAHDDELEKLLDAVNVALGAGLLPEPIFARLRDARDAYGAPLDDAHDDELEELLESVNVALGAGLPEPIFVRLRDARDAFEVESDADTEDDG